MQEPKGHDHWQFASGKRSLPFVVWTHAGWTGNFISLRDVTKISVFKYFAIAYRMVQRKLAMPRIHCLKEQRSQSQVVKGKLQLKKTWAMGDGRYRILPISASLERLGCRACGGALKKTQGNEGKLRLRIQARPSHGSQTKLAVSKTFCWNGKVAGSKEYNSPSHTFNPQNKKVGCCRLWGYQKVELKVKAGQNTKLRVITLTGDSPCTRYTDRFELMTSRRFAVRPYPICDGAKEHRQHRSLSGCDKLAA